MSILDNIYSWSCNGVCIHSVCDLTVVLERLSVRLSTPISKVTSTGFLLAFTLHENDERNAHQQRRLILS